MLRVNTTVLIIGAGPSGLAMACELARFGLPYRLIDKNPKPAQYSQALAVQAHTLEQFERYNITEEAIAHGLKLSGVSVYSESKRIVHANLDHVHSKYPYILSLRQSETERLLTEHLTRAGGHIEREVTLLDYSDGGDCIEARLQHADGTAESVEARWIIGCDGIGSKVRHAAGIGFEGNKVRELFSLADVRLNGRDVPAHEINVFASGGDFIFIAGLGNGMYRLLTEHHADSGTPGDHPSLEYFQAALDRLAGRDMHASDATWLANFSITQRRAKSYRAGNAFLVGDAAHVHSPVGGQGMNTGIQDAANLAWKLNAVSNGADSKLLDTYDGERGPVAKRLLAATSAALGAMLSQSHAVRFIRDHAAHLLTSFGSVRDKLAASASQTTIRYETGPAIVDDGGGSKLHAGDYAPDVPIRDQSGQWRTVHELIGEPSSHVIGVGTESPLTIDHKYAVLYSGTEPLVYVIRPDGYIGYRGPATDQKAIQSYIASIGATK